eukprot:gene46368-56779_t
MQTSENKAENPYLAVVAKKNRNLKKKLDKILQVEQQQAANPSKVLQPEQIALLQSKSSVERSISDLKAVREALEEVAKSLEANASAPTSAPAPTETATQCEGGEVSDVQTATDAVEQAAVSTMTESAEAESNGSAEKKEGEAAGVVDLEAPVRKLLKALHVYERYKSVTGQSLPENVDFFGKSLLGLTSIGAFNDSLSNSTRYALLYLD